MIDDGPTDRSGEICDKFIGENVKVLHIDNAGVTNVRNVGMSVATSEFIAFIDADDYIEKDYFKKLIEAIGDTNADICVCGYIEKNDHLEIKHIPSHQVGVYKDEEKIIVAGNDWIFL